MSCRVRALFALACVTLLVCAWSLAVAASDASAAPEELQQQQQSPVVTAASLSSLSSGLGSSRAVSAIPLTRATRFPPLHELAHTLSERVHHETGHTYHVKVYKSPISGCPQMDFTAPITFGSSANQGKTFNLIVDTGSSQLAVAANQCCSGVSPLYSGPAQATSLGTSTATYGDGSTWQGNVITEQVTIGSSGAGFSVTQPTTMNIIEITTATGNFFTNNNCATANGAGLSGGNQNQGIIGMAWPRLIDSQGGDNSQAFPTQYWAGRTLGQFSMLMCQSSGGLYMDGVDTTTYSGTFGYTRNTDPEWYVVSVQSIVVGSQTIGSASDFIANGANSIVDSGTTVWVIPDAVYQQVTSAISSNPHFSSAFGGSNFFAGSQCQSLPSGTSAASLNAQLPSISVVFSDGLTITMPAIGGYLMPYDDSYTVFCSGIQSSGSDHIMGWSVTNNFVIVYDQQNSLIGFAPQVACPSVEGQGSLVRVTPGPSSPSPPSAFPQGPSSSSTDQGSGGGSTTPSNPCGTGSPAWQAQGSWTACSTTCGTAGTQTQTVSCVSNGLAVAASCCGASAKPASSRVCSASSGCSWYQSPTWTVCPVSCGGGTQTRTISCVDPNGIVVSSSLCSASGKPSSSRSCATAACSSTSSCQASYSWVANAWGTCSASCGPGTQTRTVACHDACGNSVTTSLCPSNTLSNPSNGKPATVQSCQIVTCPNTVYNWRPNAWSSCTQPCGGGVQTRTVSCIDGNGNVASTQSCLPPGTNIIGSMTTNPLAPGTAQPPTQQTCNTQACPSYQWYAYPFGTQCSASCGGGVVTTSVICIDSNGNMVPSKNCINAKYPTTSKPCNTQACPASATCPVDPVWGVCSGSGDCVQGVCQCWDYFGGADCSDFGYLYLDSTTVTPDTGFNKQVQVGYTTGGGVPAVSMYVVNKDIPNVPYYIARSVPPSETGTYFSWQCESWLQPPGNYTLYVGAGASLTTPLTNSQGAVVPLHIVDPCNNLDCGKWGTCSGTSGVAVCLCADGWSGAKCQTSPPCTSAYCNYHGQCSNATGAPQCACFAGYAGQQCETASACPTPCPTGATMTSACSCLCSPPSLYTPDCSTCSLQCANGGTHDDSCTVCTCPPDKPVKGDYCQFFSVVLSFTIGSGWQYLSQDIGGTTMAASQQRFENAVCADIAFALGLAPPRCSVKALTPTTGDAFTVEFELLDEDPQQLAAFEQALQTILSLPAAKPSKSWTTDANVTQSYWPLSRTNTTEYAALQFWNGQTTSKAVANQQLTVVQNADGSINAAAPSAAALAMRWPAVAAMAAVTALVLAAFQPGRF